MKSFINNVLKKIGFQITKANGIPASHKLLNNYRYFIDKFSKISAVEGDLVECGVGFGHTLFLINHLAFVEKKGRKVWAFDSFEGFPEPAKEDESFRNPKKGEWKVITPVDLDDILFRRCQLPQEVRSRLSVVKGYFNETLPKNNIQKIALLHLDVDLYESYKTCLEQLYSLVSSGGLILFDEYKQGNTQEVFPGAAIAIDEFFKDKKETVQYDKAFDKYYVVKA